METSYLNEGKCKFESSITEKAEPSRLIPGKFKANAELFVAIIALPSSRLIRPNVNYHYGHNTLKGKAALSIIQYVKHLKKSFSRS